MMAFLRTLHPKVVAATIAAFLASLAVGLIQQVLATPSATSTLTPLELFLLTAIAPPVITFLTGYSKSGPDTPGDHA